MSRSRRILVAFVAVALTLAPSAPARADDPPRVQITLLDGSQFPDVRVVASVVDTQGTAIPGLAREDVIVSEDGRTQTPIVELAGKNAPIALVLALDTSGSMSGRPLADAKSAMGLLIKSLGAEDQAAVVSFNAAVTVRAPLTADKAALVAATDSAIAGGNTAIFDAVARSADLLAGTSPQTRRAIVLMTDGVDNSSSVTLTAIAERLRTLGYPLYVVGLGNDLDRGVLQSLADASGGGQAYVAPTSDQLGSIYSALSKRIRAEYAITYRSNARSVADGTVLTVTVQVVRSGAMLGSASATFSVPPGRGVAAPTLVPTQAPVREVAVIPPVPDGRSGPYSAEVVALLGTATALSLLLWAFVMLSRESLDTRERRRVDRLITTELDEPSERRERKSLWARAVIPFLIQIGRPLGRLAGRFTSESSRLRLQQAGQPFELGPVEFLGLQIGAALAGVTAASASALALLGPRIGWIALIGFGGAMLGLTIPMIWLDRAVRARKRRIQRALPSALDMLALSARAGMTFDGSLAQVAQRWQSALTDEFKQVLIEFRMGRDRREALRAMADRTGVPEVARFANAVIQADAMGVPISKVLRDQALEMRMRRRQRAEEAARKAPIKMLFPMVGLIFPALFVVILGPAVPALLDIFRQTR